MKKQYTLVLLLLLLVSTISAQDKQWEVDLKETLYEVGWIKQSNSGVILASGAKGFLAMDNQYRRNIMA